MKYSRILIISDTHAPYMHPDAVPFLKAMKQKYKPQKVVHIGDEIDGHSWSYHESSTNLPSADRELELAIDQLEGLYNLFPKVDVVESNHGSLHKRKAKTGGIPKKFIVGYREALEAPQGWNWHDRLVLKLCNNEEVMFVHGIGANILNVIKDLGMNVVQGHYHTKLWAVQMYMHSLRKSLFGLQVGCLINSRIAAFDYGKQISKQVAIGAGSITDGVPKPEPMVLDRHGRWIGKLL